MHMVMISLIATNGGAKDSLWVMTMLMKTSDGVNIASGHGR
jgi:hypothetical protein